MTRNAASNLLLPAGRSLVVPVNSPQVIGGADAEPSRVQGLGPTAKIGPPLILVLPAQKDSAPNLVLDTAAY